MKASFSGSNVNLDQALRALYRRAVFGITLGLEPMRQACARAGHPERAVPWVHVAGTNGKGSVCAMVESMARQAGKKTALYTSPHLCRFAERIAVNGQPIDDERLADALSQALHVGPTLSFFETATLAAFIAFRDAGCDFGVLEVGLGGRLDATNVIETPLACAITSIGLDHVQILGNSLAAIAAEKAGILKAGTPFVLGAMPQEARGVIEQRGDAIGALPAPVDDAAWEDAFAFAPTRMGCVWNTSNAPVAATLASACGFSGDTIHRGYASAFWPGRMEFIERHGESYLLEGAHNLDGAVRFAQEIVQREALEAFHATNSGLSLRRFGAPEGRVLVFGALADKAWGPVLDALAPHFPNRVYTEPKGRAAVPPAELAMRLPGHIAASPQDALAKARALGGPSALVVVSGSLYLVGECRAHLLDLPMDPPIAL